MQKISRHILVILASASLLLALLSFFFFERGALGAAEETYFSAVKERIRQELSVSQGELERITGLVSQNTNTQFSDLRQSTKYPYYVYQNGRLIFWSDYRFIPDYESIRKISETQMVTFDQSKYLVSRRQYTRPNGRIDIVSVINLYRYYKNENNYLQSGYNTNLFTVDPEQISTNVGPAYQNVLDNQNRFLFSIVPPKFESYRNQTTPVNTITWGVLAAVLFGIYIFKWVITLSRQKRYEQAFLLLTVYLFLLRAGMLYFGIPFLFSETDLFNPKFYASSPIAPSLGDLLLNCVVCFILSLYVADFYFRSKTYLFLVNTSKKVRPVLSFVFIALSFGVFYVSLLELTNIYEKSQFTLDITLSISFSILKIACLIIFILISSIYFLCTHLLVGLFIRLNPQKLFGVLTFAVSAIIITAVLFVLKTELKWIFGIHAIYFLLLYFSRFPRILYTFRYRTTIYYFMGAFFWAVVTTYVVYNEEEQKDITNKKEFGEKIIAENDDLGEYLLDRAKESISKDAEIQNSFISDTILSRERIQQMVKSIHLDKYFDKYDIEVVSFQADGQPLDTSISKETFDNYTKFYRQQKYQTKYASLYFINDLVNDFRKQYLSLIDIYKDSVLVGRVVLNLNPREDQPRNVYPELLMDKKFVQAPETRQYSYAVYDTHKNLIYSSGSYNYDRKMPQTELDNPVLFERGIQLYDYKHVGNRDKNKRYMIVSSKSYPLKSLISNFSFLYLILVLYVICIIAVYALKYGLRRLKISYTTKIQILLNVAFFTPLLLIVLITLQVITANYNSNQENSYLTSTKNIGNNFAPYLAEYMSGRRSQEAMVQELEKIARDANVDINFFNEEGNLSITTEPLIYESKLLSKWLNPEAYIHLLQDRENEVLLDESLGKKQYRTAYVTVRASNTGKPLGILSIPYFDSKPELDRQIIEVISTILSVFAIMFLLFLAISYWASNLLTIPLRLLTQKIRRINLHQLNEPVNWKSDDEIGVLVGSYNQMLKKLDDSKQELAKNEKQSAWREMAKQVAHEIKNPLTPMKLTIQQLQRTMLRDLPPNLPQNERIKRTFESLIDQIDNISDIATSFSDFAKMPLPKNELFEISSVLNKAADLYADDTKITLRRDIQTRRVNVIGDRQLIGRIITNLIINGIQSVPSGRRPEILLRLRTDEGNVYIEVQDNGNGIPEAIRPKVFLPNFSTKQDGSGLGLAIAKRGVEHAGGTIWFETEEGTGTTFFLSLPLTHGNRPVEVSLP
ncbi:sensor histidine kinase [Runella sp.]|uniref:sensor histidine kinase n=1 Tax=Runella sp. TaxID=1960881 RepID=UPI003D14A549